MALGDSFITWTQLADYMGADAEVEGEEGLDSAVKAATSAIIDCCGRDFNSSATATERTFFPSSPHIVRTDDFYTDADLVVKVDGIEITEFDLLPINGIVDGRTVPYREIVTKQWMGFGARVTVTAKWGWASVPDGVVQATKILGAEYYKLREAPFGTSESAGKGPGKVELDCNHTAWKLIKAYRTQQRAVFLG